jgi:hypothetical protein
MKRSKLKKRKWVAPPPSELPKHVQFADAIQRVYDLVYRASKLHPTELRFYELIMDVKRECKPFCSLYPDDVVDDLYRKG